MWFISIKNVTRLLGIIIICPEVRGETEAVAVVVVVVVEVVGTEVVGVFVGGTGTFDFVPFA